MTRGREGGFPVRLRRASLADLERIAGIERDSHPNPWSTESLRAFLSAGDRIRFLVAEFDSGMGGRRAPVGVIGFGILRIVADEAELLNLAVAPEARRSGAGSALLDRLLVVAVTEGVRRVFLEVRESNEAARILYRERGFRDMGVRRQYYSQPVEDARVLRLDFVSGVPRPGRTPPPEER